MPLTSLLYISRSLIDPVDAPAVIAQIVSASVTANRARGFTGALLSTGTHFAQVLEGRALAIDAVYSVIARDPRHDQLRIVDRAPLAARRFASWDMAYSGPSQFVARHVMRLQNDQSESERSRAAAWLTELLHEFARP